MILFFVLHFRFSEISFGEQIVNLNSSIKFATSTKLKQTLFMSPIHKTLTSKELKLIICSPKEISENLNWNTNSNINIVDKISDIDLSSIQCVMTDVFISMNDQDNESKVNLLKNYIVNDDLISKTNKDSVFMHCLPAKVGFEVTKSIFESSKSIVWRQAYNRLIAQKKLLQFINWN